MRNRLVLFAPLSVFTVVAPVLWLALERDPQELPSAREGQLFPDFSLSQLADSSKTLQAEDLRGEVTLVNVWATWCYACTLEHPMLNELATEGIKIVGLNYKDDRAAAIQWLERRGDPYAFTIFDEHGSLGLDLGVYGAPETYLLDAKGMVQYRRVGVLDERVWRDDFASRYTELVLAEENG